MWRSTAQRRSAQNTFPAPWTHLYFTFRPHLLLSSTNEGYRLAPLRRTGHVALRVFFIIIYLFFLPVSRCPPCASRCTVAQRLFHASTRKTNMEIRPEALTGRCTQPAVRGYREVVGYRGGGGVGVGQWVGCVLLSIHYVSGVRSDLRSEPNVLCGEDRHCGFLGRVLDFLLWIYIYIFFNTEGLVVQRP